MFHHPDKGGDLEKMLVINEAYTTLIHADKRGTYHKQWALFKEFEEDPVLSRHSGYLNKDKTIPFSETFKKEHREGAFKYRITPLKITQLVSYFSLHEAPQFVSMSVI